MPTPHRCDATVPGRGDEGVEAAGRLTLHGPRADAQGVGGFLDRKVAVEAEDDHRPASRGQLLEQLHQRGPVDQVHPGQIHLGRLGQLVGGPLPPPGPAALIQPTRGSIRRTYASSSPSRDPAPVPQSLTERVETRSSAVCQSRRAGTPYGVADPAGRDVLPVLVPRQPGSPSGASRPVKVPADATSASTITASRWRHQVHLVRAPVVAVRRALFRLMCRGRSVMAARLPARRSFCRR